MVTEGVSLKVRLVRFSNRNPHHKCQRKLKRMYEGASIRPAGVSSLVLTSSRTQNGDDAVSPRKAEEAKSWPEQMKGNPGTSFEIMCVD